MESGFLKKEEFYDYDEMSRSFNHSKILRIVCRALENAEYEWLTDVRVNKTTVGHRLASAVRFVADVIGYKTDKSPKDFSVIIEYETIDSGRSKNGRLKILNYLDRMFEVMNVEAYIMIAVFTTTITRRTRNKEKDIWGMPRERKEIYKELILQLDNEIKKLPEESKLVLISIFDDKILCQIFNRNGEEKEKRVEKFVSIREG